MDMKNVFLIGPSVKLNGGVSNIIKAILGSDELNKKYRIYAIETVGKKRIFTFITSIIKIFSIKSTDIVHFNVASNGSFIRKYILYKLINNNTKKIFHLHGGGFINYYKKSNKFIKRCIVDMLDGCDLIVNVSNYMRQRMCDEFPKISYKSITLYNGIQLKKFKARIYKKNNTILFMGKIVDYKGIFDLVEIVDNEKYFLREKEWRIIVAGNGEVTKLKKIVAEKEIGDLIEIVGWVAGEKKKKLLEEASIVVIPSHIESFGITAIEAMANGCSIVATKVGGLPEIVHDTNGYIVKCGDFEGFEEAIKSLINDNKLRENLYYRNILESKKFEEEIMFRNIASIYSKL